ncbi:hypothetical protein MTR_6g045193 [Medicago truncatula]|uniref:Uncharacterized protein n=1 Tax=Medicago truncatula TaxID=3880 RepID=A0A072U8M2_MEDTR|nr:hypothetical protein MTR_6g045193 [Medicago truncatula]
MTHLASLENVQARSYTTTYAASTHSCSLSIKEKGEKGRKESISYVYSISIIPVRWIFKFFNLWSPKVEIKIAFEGIITKRTIGKSINFNRSWKNNGKQRNPKHLKKIASEAKVLLK